MRTQAELDRMAVGLAAGIEQIVKGSEFCLVLYDDDGGPLCTEDTPIARFAFAYDQAAEGAKEKRVLRMLEALAAQFCEPPRAEIVALVEQVLAEIADDGLREETEATLKRLVVVMRAAFNAGCGSPDLPMLVVLDQAVRSPDGLDVRTAELARTWLDVVKAR